MLKEIHSVHFPKDNNLLFLLYEKRTSYTHSTLFKQGQLHGPATCAVNRGPCLEGPTLALKCYCHYLEILSTVWTRGPALLFFTGPVKLLSQY